MIDFSSQNVYIHIRKHILIDIYKEISGVGQINPGIFGHL